jgi:GNAT superfamily N-acetyltransferase
MRIRNFRQSDIPMLIDLQQLAAETDGLAVEDMIDFAAWSTYPELIGDYTVFVITDDDETNEWGQAGTLEGVEGEVVGFTALIMLKEAYAYHFLCQGTVHPQHRKRNAGRALLICALNYARMVSTEFEFEAEQLGQPLHLEALLPLNDPASVNLARKCDMQPVDEPVMRGMRLYRREL